MARVHCLGRSLIHLASHAITYGAAKERCDSSPQDRQCTKPLIGPCASSEAGGCNEKVNTSKKSRLADPCPRPLDGVASSMLVCVPICMGRQGCMHCAAHGLLVFNDLNSHLGDHLDLHLHRAVYRGGRPLTLRNTCIYPCLARVWPMSGLVSTHVMHHCLCILSPGLFTITSPAVWCSFVIATAKHNSSTPNCHFEAAVMLHRSTCVARPGDDGAPGRETSNLKYPTRCISIVAYQIYAARW